MKPRITVDTNKNGELEIWLNEDGRDLLVRELQRVSEKNDHFHLGPEDISDVQLSDLAYRDGDTVNQWGKVLFRPDE
jgi:hypothetical protein